MKKAYLAGGCFWGFEELFRKENGVLSTVVGYMGGLNDNPTYQDHPGHAEALEITYDPEQISFKQLLDFFFRIHNPTTLNQQGNDKGSAYRSAIFYQDQSELEDANNFIEIVNTSGRWDASVVTKLESFTTFWQAEGFHQNYLQENPHGYTCHYVRWGTYL